MKTQAYQILCSVYDLLRQSPSTSPAADLIATALELDPEDAAPAAEISNLQTSQLTNFPTYKLPNLQTSQLTNSQTEKAVPADPRPPTPAPDQEKHKSIQIQKIQKLIDDHSLQNLKDVLAVIHSAGFSYSTTARLLECTSAGISNAAKRGGRDIEKRFWKVFSKPNITPKEEVQNA